MPSGKGPGMSRPSAASKAGLDATLKPARGGKYRIILTDDQGTEVFNSVHSSEKAAKVTAANWVAKHYDVEVREAPRPKKAPTHRNLGPSPGNMVAVMRARADDNEVRAVSLRAQADELESEAKRLRVAADALEGPDAHSEGS